MVIREAIEGGWDGKRGPRRMRASGGSGRLLDRKGVWSFSVPMPHVANAWLSLCGAGVVAQEPDTPARRHGGERAAVGRGRGSGAATHT